MNIKYIARVHKYKLHIKLANLHKNWHAPFKFYVDNLDNFLFLLENTLSENLSLILNINIDIFLLLCLTIFIVKTYKGL